VKHLWTVVCRQASVDRESNVLNLLEVIEEITVRFHDGEPPVVASAVLPIPMQIVSFWEKGTKHDKDERFRMLLRTPQNPQPDGKIEGTIDGGPGKRARTIARVGEIPWRGIGTYSFVVQVARSGGWRTVAEIPWELKRAAVTAEQPAPAKSESDRKPERKAKTKRRR
jgi:hypothetical protein